MGITLHDRRDFTLDTYERVAWRGEPVSLADEALARIAACRASFLELIDRDSTVVIYGVTTSMGERAHDRLGPEERAWHAELKPFAAATAFGEELPGRIVRGIVLARLANFIEGHAATSARIALAVAQMLGGAPLPAVAAAGQGGAGEILALYPLFAELSTRFVLEVKERGSLINGSPCAAALIADSALAARRRIDLAVQSFALSIEAFRAPLEHYDAALEPLWGDWGETVALQSLRQYLAGAGDGRRNFQAPVSYRIVPRVLGQAFRALREAEEGAAVSLRSVSDNPVYIPPDMEHPLGRTLSTGGYHNTWAAPALDGLAAVWADICILCDRHSAKLLDGRVSQLPEHLLVARAPGTSDGHGNVGYIPMAANGYTELAKAAAQTTFIPGGDSGASSQDDVAAPAFLAWTKEARAGRCTDASLAMLAVLASQALFVTEREVPPSLVQFVSWVRSIVPPVVEDRVLGPELGRLTESFTARVFGAE